MRHAAALLNPITWPKPFGLVMAEALATAMPVLAFPNGAEPEIIDHSQAPVIRTLIRTRPLAGGPGRTPGCSALVQVRTSWRPCLGRQVQPERADPGLEHSGVKRLARTGARLQDSHGFLSSCGSAEAHASTPEHFRRSETLRTTVSRGTGISLSLRSRK